MKPLTFIRGAWFACAFTLLSILLLDCSEPAFATTTCTKADSFECTKFHSTGDKISSGSAGGSIVRTIVGLAIVVGIIYGLYWILKQTRATKNPATGYGLEQLAALPLGPGKSMALVRVGDEVHLVGLSENGVTSLRVYTEEEAYELGLPLEGPVTPSDPNAGLPPIQRLVETLKRFTVR